MGTPVSTPLVTTEDPADAVPDLTARRPEVVRRLLDRGVPPRTLQALLPGWEVAVREDVPPR